MSEGSAAAFGPTGYPCVRFEKNKRENLIFVLPTFLCKLKHQERWSLVFGFNLFLLNPLPRVSMGLTVVEI